MASADREIAGYTFARYENEALLQGTSLPVEGLTINVYYTKDEIPTNTVTVQYLDKETGAELAPADTVKFAAGSAYDVTAYGDKKIAGYRFDSISDNAAGSALTSDITVTVYYSKETTEDPQPETYTVTINYYRRGTTDKIADSKTLKLNAGGALRRDHRGLHGHFRLPPHGNGGRGKGRCS